MTAKTDVTVYFNLNPRLGEIGAGDTSISVQDSHDTLTNIEDGAEGGQHPKLVVTDGAQDLGGGVSVGLTTELQNFQWAFEGTAPRCAGSVTTGDANGVVLIDSGATFITDGVVRGDWVINFDDQSVTEVLTVDSENQLTTRGLRNGTLNTFGSADAYKVWEVSEAELGGGNFVAVDEFAAKINPLFPTFGRFVSKASASTATQLNNAEITLILKIMRNRMETDPDTGILTIWDDDDTTVLLQGNIYEDVLAAQIYRGRGMERRNRLA